MTGDREDAAGSGSMREFKWRWLRRPARRPPRTPPLQSARTSGPHQSAPCRALVIWPFVSSHPQYLPLCRWSAGWRATRQAEKPGRREVRGRAREAVVSGQATERWWGWMRRALAGVGGVAEKGKAASLHETRRRGRSSCCQMGPRRRRTRASVGARWSAKERERRRSRRSTSDHSLFIIGIPTTAENYT